MATYVNDLRLKEIGTGESSGTWGSETNTNLELIGEALGFGTEAITTNADTHTTTVADGSTDPGRAMYLKYTGTLDSACTITIAPNTMSRMHFIENGTSGSQNIIISQGTGANVTIPAGDVKAVYLDGAGSGAAVVDAFASLSTVDLKVQDDLTVTDDVSIGGATTIGGVLDITDTTDSSDATGDTGALRTEGGASIAKKLFVGTDLDVDGTTNLDVVDIDGAVDMASTLQVDGAITSSAGATITLADNTDNLTLTTTDADASVGPNLKMYRNSGSPADNDLLGAIDFEGRNDNSQDVVYSQIFTQILDASDGTEDGYLSFKVMNAGTSRQRLLFDAGETVFNDESEDVDFRVESNGNANMLFVDAGNDYVAMGASTDLSGALNITHGAEFGLVTSGPFNFQAKFESTDAEAAIVIEDSNSGTDYNRIGVITNDMAFTTNNSERVRIDSSGLVGIGTSAPHELLHVEGGDGTQALVAVKEDTATATASYMFKVDSTGTDVRKKAGLIFQRDDPGTRGTGVLHICVDGANDEGSAAVADSKMAFLASGEVCVRTTTAVNSAFLTVQSNDNGGIVVGQSGTNAYRNYRHVVSTGIHTFASSNNTASLSNAGAWTNASDIAYKNNIVDTVHGLETIKQLQPRDYKLKADNTEHTGFIAQELETVLPQFVIGEEGHKNVNYAQITAVLTKAMKELEARVTTLEG